MKSATTRYTGRNKMSQNAENTKKLNIKKPDIKGACKKISEDLVTDRPNAVEWIALAVVLLIIFTCLFYGDNFTIMLTAFQMDDYLIKGVSIEGLGNNYFAYGLVHQIVTEIWVLPMSVINQFHKLTSEEPWLVMWFKLLAPVLLTLCMQEMIRIGKLLEMKTERIKWMLLILSSSVLVALPVFHISQTDIMYTYLMLIGLEAALREDKKGFILFMALATSCKVITIFAFIPMLLIMEKRILRCALDALIVIAVYPVENLWYKLVSKLNGVLTASNAVISQVQAKAAETVQTVTEAADTVSKSQDEVINGFMDHFFNKALYFEFPAIRKGYSASLLVLLMVLLCIWCYVQRKDDIKNLRYNYIYAAAVAWLIFFTMASPSPYWIVVLYPFLMLMIFMKPECIRTGMLLQYGFTMLMFLMYVLDTGWVYGGPGNLDFLLLKGLLPEGHDSENGPGVYRYLNNLGLPAYTNIITAICLACAIGLVVLYHYRVKVTEDISEKEENKLMHGFAILQIGFLWVWFAVVVFVVSRW